MSWLSSMTSTRGMTDSRPAALPPLARFVDEVPPHRYRPLTYGPSLHRAALRRQRSCDRVGDLARALDPAVLIEDPHRDVHARAMRDGVQVRGLVVDAEPAGAMQRKLPQQLGAVRAVGPLDRVMLFLAVPLLAGNLRRSAPVDRQCRAGFLHEPLERFEFSRPCDREHAVAVGMPR